MPPDPDDKNDPPKPDPKPDEGKRFTQDELDHHVETRLAKERKKYSDYADLKAKAEKFDALEESNKTETQKLTDDLAAERKAREEADLRAARIEVAAEKGLSTTQARRLVGTNKEELEADADASIEDGTFVVGDGAKPKPPPSEKPKPNLKGGNEPDDEADVESPAKLAEAIPRP